MSSMPAENPDQAIGAVPMARRCSAGTDAWVIDAGCEMSVSTPPRLSASDISRTAPSSRPARLERSEVEREHAAEPAHLTPRQFVLRMRRQPGVVDLAHLGMTYEHLRRAPDRSALCRHPQRQRLGAAQDQPRVERARGWRPRRSARTAATAASSSRVATTIAADAVAVSVQVFGRAVGHEIGAKLDRPLNRRAGEGVVRRPSRTACAAADATAARGR